MRIGYNRNNEDQYNKFIAVILAAGLSSRMKEFKPLLPVDGRTAIEGLAESAKGAGIDKIIVVTGHKREDLRDVIRKHELTEAFNPDYEQGMFTSIRRGLKQASEVMDGESRGVFLIPVDCPLISINVLRSVMDAAGNNFAVPTYEGKKGHPLFIPREFMDDVISYDGAGGLKAITDRHWDRMDRVPVSEEGCIMDMDTPEGYEEIRRFVEIGYTRTRLEIAAARRRFILIRHGQTRQHEEPMFIGQYDVPLSEEGRGQMRDAGEEVAKALRRHYEEDVKRDFFGNVVEHDMPDWSNTIYCSDLKRAEESAEILAEVLRGSGVMVDDEENGVRANGIHVKALQSLREINLGEWDGRPIREIAANCPEEYQRRGEDLFTFKMGNGSENFYDMQYRVVRALREILASDDGKNIIIVFHAGVIRAIENNLKGLRVDDEWHKIDKGSIVEVQGRG
ncbi:MAG: histidine phosphatase family protein [Bacillota bacterium]|nr:histidine phosphatase family protein [Bacillota bacterium]